MEQLRMLWQLQKLEQEITGKETALQNIPSVNTYRACKTEVATLQDTMHSYAEKMEEARKLIRRSEMDLRLITGSIADLNKKLYGGEVHNTRELESMGKKLLTMQAERSAMEDHILDVMEGLEKDESENSELCRRAEAGQERLRQVKARAQHDMQTVRQELAELNRQREKLIEQIEAPLLQRYRELKAKLPGQCISLVLNNFCGICNVSLPTAFRERMLKPGHLVYCENCGSLLVPGD